jgi:predicted component of type VI protein secretion system
MSHILAIEHRRIARDPSQAEAAVEIMSAFIDQVPQQAGSTAANTAAMITERFAGIGEMVPAQINAIITLRHS